VALAGALSSSARGTAWYRGRVEACVTVDTGSSGARQGLANAPCTTHHTLHGRKYPPAACSPAVLRSLAQIYRSMCMTTVLAGAPPAPACCSKAAAGPCTASLLDNSLQHCTIPPHPAPKINNMELSWRDSGAAAQSAHVPVCCHTLPVPGPPGRVPAANSTRPGRAGYHWEREQQVPAASSTRAGRGGHPLGGEQQVPNGFNEARRVPGLVRLSRTEHTLGSADQRKQGGPPFQRRRWPGSTGHHC
jgi:hypothetical protein